MTLTETLKKLELNIGRRLMKAPSSLVDIEEEPFLKNVASMGIDMVWNDMIKAGKIVVDRGRIYKVADKFKGNYSGEVENIF